MKYVRPAVAALCIATALTACNKGIESEPQVATGPGAMTGLVTYRNWPSPDSLRDLRIVAFKNFPPGDIVSEVLQSRAVVYPPLGDTALVPFLVDSLRYKFILEAGTYEYVVVAQQFGPNVLADWRPVGQYDLDTDLSVPSPVIVPAADTVRNINIIVDFVNRPPTPF